MQRFMNFLGFNETYEEDNGLHPDGEALDAPKRRGQLFNLHAQKQMEIVIEGPRPTT